LFLQIKKPIIAALHGYVLGSGIEMAMCCDIRVASDDAKFGVPEMGLGIIPAAAAARPFLALSGGVTRWKCFIGPVDHRRRS